jgi:hypothetical protein
VCALQMHRRKEGRKEGRKEQAWCVRWVGGRAAAISLGGVLCRNECWLGDWAVR